MKYPMSKYRFYEYEEDGVRCVKAVSTYCGKNVAGVAKTAPSDTYNSEFGKRLAALRCNKAIAAKRAKRAERKREEAKRELEKSIKYFTDMCEYNAVSSIEYAEACRELSEAEETELENHPAQPSKKRKPLIRTNILSPQ